MVPQYRLESPPIGHCPEAIPGEPQTLQEQIHRMPNDLPERVGEESGTTMDDKNGSQPWPPTGIRGLYGSIPTVWFERGETLSDYGVNAVWIGSGGLTHDGIALLREQGATVFAEFNTMHEARYIADHPDAAPVGIDGQICPAPDGWQGVCPTHTDYRADRMTKFRRTLREFDIDGIWLDYHHSHASWEQAKPNLPDTCFCARCLERFTSDTGVPLPPGGTGSISGWLLGKHREAWTAWRCSVFTDWVREFREILDVERPRALLGTFHCPWTDEEHEGALRYKLAIDLRAQAPYLDVFSTMPYHARFGHVTDPAWISRQTSWLGRYLGISGALDERRRIWPIVQIADWGEPVPLDQIDTVISNGLRSPSTGVMVFAWHGLHDEPEKQNAIGAAYRERAER